MLSRSRKIFLFVITVAMVQIVVGCASRQLRSDFDPSVDFSQYETYNFFDDAGPQDTNYRSFFSEYMVAAISREMDARGYVKSGDPDLLINFNGVLQEKTRVTTTPVMTGSYYDYRRGFYDPWMDYRFAEETYVSQYTEGTFNIDFVDAKKMKLVFEIVGVSNVSKKDLAELEHRVNEGVPAYFAEYPFRAGGGN